MTNIILHLIEIFQPIVTLLVSVFAPILIKCIAQPLICLLRVTEESKQLEIENILRNSLHQSASNAIKFAMSKLQTSDLSPEVIELARKYVYTTNPDTINQLQINEQTISDILYSKADFVQSQPSSTNLLVS
ncbi:MAG: hypothetical protein C4617_03770 [Candidatus Liberibacter europaeus]|uniref:Uncharacterized protein n=1 Tax=Candidatus Liberibacter europaeus TaxID=744859 RepID=A0A2T4VX31_9HYPH|nr:hypothetical protein [Candidatus Liberibacter europaeus]PTL86332.1 MAG: hypothetical protein C4617_03770 [Candidatus Liberibacter europaeus]